METGKPIIINKTAMLHSFKDLFVHTYDRYTAKEKQLIKRTKWLDWIGMPLFIFLYIALCSTCGGGSGNDRVRPPMKLTLLSGATTLLSLFVLYQHLRVLPYPIDNGDDMFKSLQVLGRWIFITRHTLAIQAIHQTFSLLGDLGYDLVPRAYTHCVSMLIAGLAAFVTIQFFVLVVCSAEP